MTPTSLLEILGAPQRLGMFGMAFHAQAGHLQSGVVNGVLKLGAGSTDQSDAGPDQPRAWVARDG